MIVLRAALIAALCSLAACGGEQEHEPLISGDVTGSFEGTSFTIAEGVAAVVDSNHVIALGTDAINCGTPTQPTPPSGYFASIALPSFDEGVYGSVFVTVYENHGDFSGHGSNSGSVEISAVDATSLSGTVAFSYTASDTGESYSLDGTFDVVVCE